MGQLYQTSLSAVTFLTSAAVSASFFSFIDKQLLVLEVQAALAVSITLLVQTEIKMLSRVAQTSKRKTQSCEACIKIFSF